MRYMLSASGDSVKLPGQRGCATSKCDGVGFLCFLVLPKPSRHAPASEIRRGCVLFVDPPYQLQVLLALARRRIVETGAVHAQQIALPPDDRVRRAPPLSRRRRSAEIIRFHVPQVPTVPHRDGSLTLAGTHKFPRGGKKWLLLYDAISESNSWSARPSVDDRWGSRPLPKFMVGPNAINGR